MVSIIDTVLLECLIVREIHTINLCTLLDYFYSHLVCQLR